MSFADRTCVQCSVWFYCASSIILLTEFLDCVTYCVVFLCENSSTASIVMGHSQNCHELFMFVLAVDWLAGDIDGVQSLCLLHSFSMHHGHIYTFSMSMLKSFMNNTCRERTLCWNSFDWEVMYYDHCLFNSLSIHNSIHVFQWRCWYWCNCSDRM